MNGEAIIRTILYNFSERLMKITHVERLCSHFQCIQISLACGKCIEMIIRPFPA